MVELARHGSPIGSVYDLTAALGFVLARSPALLAAIIRRLPSPWAATAPDAVTLALEVRDQVGRTDLELATRDGLLIVEAKRDWLLPTIRQLSAYTPRIHAHGNGALITLSQANAALAATRLPVMVDGVPVVHLSWRDVMADTRHRAKTLRGDERLWLNEFLTYLQGVLRLRSIADSWTYCVVLNEERPGGGGSRTFREFVTDEHAYFHPYGVSGWPLEPPNFMAFRWKGATHRLHRIVNAQIEPNLQQRWPDIPVTPDTNGTAPGLVDSRGVVHQAAVAVDGLIISYSTGVSRPSRRCRRRRW